MDVNLPTSPRYRKLEAMVNPHLEYSDSSLFRQAQVGNQEAATRLYYRYAQRIRRLFQSKTSADVKATLDSEDIVQSVFASFFRGMGLGYYDVPTGGELWNLLLVIALNKIRAKATYSKAAKRDIRKTQGGDILEAVPNRSDSADDQILQLAIDEALAELQPQDNQIITLRIQGHEVAEIAEKVRRSKRSVERVLQGFRKKLSRRLEAT